MQVAKFKDIKMQLLKDMCLMCALRVPYVCLVAIVVCMYRLSHTPYM